MPRLQPINADPREVSTPGRAAEANLLRLTASGARLVYDVRGFRVVSVHLRAVPAGADMSGAVFRVRRSNFPAGADAADFAETVEFSAAGGFAVLEPAAAFLVVEQTGTGTGAGEPRAEVAVFGVEAPP